MPDDSTQKPSRSELLRRMAWLDDYTSRLGGQAAALPLRCPCCFCRTLSERATFEICAVCFWEDDGQDDDDAEVVRGGPNGALSLTQARANYRRLGACDEQSLAHVRPPTVDERPEDSSA